MPQPLRCLVVEDQLMIQQLLAGMLERHPSLEVVGTASTAADGIAACLQFRPDLAILDFALPDGDGLTVARSLKVIQPTARVIMLSSFASTLERPMELAEQIVAIVDKSRAYQDLISEVEALLPETDCSSRSQSQVANLELLTRRELEILNLIGQGLTSREIADQLNITLRTVETHRHHICSKLGMSGSALIRLAVLVPLEPPSPADS